MSEVDKFLSSIWSLCESSPSPLSSLQPQWDSLVLHFPEWQIFLIGSFLVSFLAFWTPSLLFLVLDLSGQPVFLLRYKTQSDVNVPLDWALFVKGFKRVAFNFFILNSAVGYVTFPIFRYTSGSFDRPLPNLAEIICHLICFVLIEEVGFYYSHRLFHSPYFYKRFHKIHHEWIAPIAMSAIYAHPLEHVFSNLAPVIAGPVILGSHVATVWIWFAVALINTTYSHSGYHFPLTSSTQSHDYHHLKFSNNFGAMGLLDYLHGTDNHYRASPQFKNDFTFFSLIPVWDLTDTAKDIKGKGKKPSSLPKEE